MIDGLKPLDFGGKKYLSPKEALKRLEKYAPGQTNPTPPPTPSPSSDSQNGDFGIDDIVKNAQGNFEFRGLVTPTGTWSVITLAGQQFEGGKKLNYEQWIQYSNGTAEVNNNGDFIQLPRPVVRKFRITPSRLRYRLMRAVYEKRNSKTHQPVVKELKDLFYKDDHNPWQHNAELIDYRAEQKAVITTQGWPADHPFSTSIDAPLAGDSPVEIKAGCGLEEQLGALAGDSDPARVKEVLEYHDQPQNKTTQLWRLDTDYTGKRVVVFGVGYGSAVIYAYGDYFDDSCPARRVDADAKNFHTTKRGGT